MGVKFTPGAVFRVPVGSDAFAHAVMLEHSPYIAFYHQDITLNSDGNLDEPPMFIIGVAHETFSKSWGKPILKIPTDKLPPLPKFFRQNPLSKYDCVIVDPHKSTVPAKPEDCINLEAQGVWHDFQIESRISDTYAGLPNIFVDTLRVKL